VATTHKHLFYAPDNTESQLPPVKGLRSKRESPDPRTEQLNAKLIGQSDLMRTLKQSIRTVATSSETVLISGESGTGKELIARAIHELGARRSKPFVAINCGALTESLLESELFGHVRGSFTGATGNKKGFFEAAGDGTIFLDEFAEMSLATQSRLLRVLEERTVRPVGLTEAKEIPLSARVVVATNHDLRHDVAVGRFRHDLYYRVNVLQICAPALRDRCDDILALAQHFLRKYKDRNRSQISDHISPEVLAHLKGYSWPGNVRELENIINRLASKVGDARYISRQDLLGEPELDQCNLRSLHDVEREAEPEPLDSGPLGFPNGRIQALSHCQCRSRKELDRYNRVVDEVNGNLTEAARRLKVPRTTLIYRVARLKDDCGLSGTVQSLANCQCRSRKEIDQYIRLVDEVNGNLAKAARTMGIPRQTLHNRLLSLRNKCGISGL
jgi:transcriptional regulator with PAS, ATPase and Fis domain